MPTVELSVIFQLSAAHFLTDYQGECEQLHGHNYKIIVSIEDTLKKNGLVLDFKAIKKIYREKVHTKLDHTNLNDLLAEQPSAENLSIWIWKALQNDLPLKSITVYETDQCFCKYEGK